MKLVTFYSDSHIKLYELFLESFNKFLSKKYTLLPKKIDQVSPTGVYNSKGFDVAMVEKLNWIIENINISDNQPMIFSDCDVQFFGDLIFDMKDNDILFQHDYHEFFDLSWYPDGNNGKGIYPNYCAGFFICKQNVKILNFFIDVRKKLLENLNGTLHDQTVLNKMLNDGYDIKHDKLNPNQYWTVGFSTQGVVWDGQPIKTPKDIIVHHANFTVGIQNKLNLLKLVKQQKLLKWDMV